MTNHNPQETLVSSTLMCSKCLNTFPSADIKVRKDEQVCPRCHSDLDFEDDLLAEKEAYKRQRRSGRGRNAPAPASPPKMAPSTPLGAETPPPPPATGGRQIAPQTRNIEAAELDSAGRQWYAVMVYGGDTKAARALRDYFKRRNPKAVGRVLVPKKHQEVLVGGKFTIQYRAAMPGYLLLKCRPDCLDELKRAPHVSSVLPYSDPVSADKYERMEEEGVTPPAPTPIPKSQVEPFLKRGPKPEHTPIGLGDTVQVRAGQWEGQIGKVTVYGFGQVEMCFVILGQLTTILEPMSNVQKITPEG